MTAMTPRTDVAPAGAAAVEAPPRSWKAPIAMGVFGLLALIAFGVYGSGSQTSGFRLDVGGDAVLPTVTVPSQAGGVVLGVLCLMLTAYAADRVRRYRGVPLWVTGPFGVIWVLAFLVWAVAGNTISFPGLLRGSLLLAVPLIFGALSGVLCERAGVINIGIEGQLLAGAFFSAFAASLAGSLYVGLVAAPIAGLVVGALLAVFAIIYLVDQIIVGVVLNVLVLGLTSFFYGRLMVPNADAYNAPGVFEAIAIPVLSDLPLLGPVLFNQTILVYLLYVIVVGAHIALFKTAWGLRVRAVGEHPAAADTVGIKVNRVRFRNVMLGGAVAGLGGAAFTLSGVGAFVDNMTGGKGFIALAAMIFGRWSPVGALAAALLFGFAENVQNVLGIVGTPIPGELMLMAPYLVTIFAVAGLVGRIRPPAADGKPYVKG